MLTTKRNNLNRTSKRPIRRFPSKRLIKRRLVEHEGKEADILHTLLNDAAKYSNLDIKNDLIHITFSNIASLLEYTENTCYKTKPFTRDETEETIESIIKNKACSETKQTIEPITKNKALDLIHVYKHPYLNFTVHGKDSAIFQSTYANQRAFYSPRKKLKILTVLSVENRHLELLYELKKADLQDTYGDSVVEKTMFHSASFEKVRAICKENFNYRLSGTNRGCFYGQGVAFSPKFAYANYFDNKSSGCKIMLQCKMLFMKAHVGDEDTVVPDEGFDSTMKRNGDVVVKYDDDVFLPVYVIFYNLT